MLRSVLVSSAIIVTLLAVNVQAAPLSVDIVDHDFTFDVPYFEDPGTGAIVSAVYDYNGTGADSLSLTVNSAGPPLTASAGWHNVAGYSYAGNLPQVPANPPNPLLPPPATIPAATPPPASSWLYPLFFTGQYGARLEILMDFDTNDGPYTNTTGDVFDVSLTGKTGFLRITGWIGGQGWGAPPQYPDPPQQGGPPQDIVLLEIEFDAVTLLARAGHSTADLIEGVGEIKTLLGWDMQDLAGLVPELDEMDGVTFFKFMLPDLNDVLFPLLPPGENYDPMENYGLETAYGHISGEAGLGMDVPEPATLALLGLGGLGMLLKRRRSRV